ncbi:hypothetical protein [Pectobacterium aroidearum]|uniref:hypothetical protein n=1 Tax=Pectobacterium aroidearum TaxID=1201031 RepID=UPI0026090ACC|nr:hypothetical protein [Pectobacterium aroidearum]WKA63182.1 hypothetical protein QX495_03285 [Pectobacterium aroidearum]
MNFNAGSFSDLAGSDLGQRLWSFMNERETLIRMEAGTYLSRPALESVQPSLIERFGNEVNNENNDRLKQMLGRMARQVMEHHGYQLDQMGVRLRRSELFLSAARYKK